MGSYCLYLSIRRILLKSKNVRWMVWCFLLHPPNDYHLPDLWLHLRFSQAAWRAHWSRKLCEKWRWFKLSLLPRGQGKQVWNAAIITTSRPDNKKWKIIKRFNRTVEGRHVAKTSGSSSIVIEAIGTVFIFILFYERYFKHLKRK